MKTVQNMSTGRSLKLLERQNAVRLPLASDVADDAAEPVLRQHAQQDFAGARQMLGSSVACGVVDRNRKIRLRGGKQPLFNRFPRGQAVR